MRVSKGNKRLIYFLVLLPISFNLLAQQLPDTSFVHTFGCRAYQPESGPVVLIDGAHNNLHTVERGFLPFAKLLRTDGYVVKGLDERQNMIEKLGDAEIFVIANALHESNIDNWKLPNPSAFTDEEITLIQKWVKQGGSLLLIADHMPFAGASANLAKTFGFKFINGFARTGSKFWPPSEFNLNNGKLLEGEITNGVINNDRVTSVTTFTGSAFALPDQAKPVLKFGHDDSILTPEIAWQFSDSTPVKSLQNYFQGAVMEYGKGKVAVFGEAAMFTAQTVNNGTVKVGFNSRLAPQNAQFVLNVVHWLDDLRQYADSGLMADTGITAEILAVNRQMEEAYRAGDLKMVSSFYVKDAVMIGNSHEVAGQKAIENYWLQLQGKTVDWSLENTEIIPYDKVVIQRGISRMTFRQDSKKVVSNVRFTLVWVHTGYGWKIRVDHYSRI